MGAKQGPREVLKITRFINHIKTQAKIKSRSRPGRLQDAPGHSVYQLFRSFWADPGPSKGPFLKKVDFEGDPKIVILGTEST